MSKYSVSVMFFLQRFHVGQVSEKRCGLFVSHAAGAEAAQELMWFIADSLVESQCQ